MNLNPLVQKAVEIVGSQSELARLCNVKQGHVWKWLRMETIPAERAVQIERATSGKIPRHELRPDLWSASVVPATEEYRTEPTAAVGGLVTSQ